MSHKTLARRIADWAVALLLSAALIFSLVDRIALSILLEPIKLNLDLSDIQLGLLNGIAFGVFYAVLGLPMGWLADKWSRKGTILIGIAVWSLATAACGFATSFMGLLTARILVGAGEAGLAPASYGILHSRFAKGGLGLAVSVFHIGGMIGSGVGLMATGAIYDFLLKGGGEAWPVVGHLEPWQLTFVLVALPGPLFVIVLSFLRDHRPAPQQDIAHEPSVSLLGALRQTPGRYASLFLGMACMYVGTYALLSWMPAILIREHQLSSSQIGLSYGLIVMLACPAGLLISGACSDYFEKRSKWPIQVTIALAAALLALPLSIGLAYADSVAAKLTLAGLLHFCLSAPMGVVPALIQVEAPAEARARISGFYVMVATLVGLGVGASLIGGISSALDPAQGTLRQAVTTVMAPALTIACILFLLRVRMDRAKKTVDAEAACTRST